MICKTYQQQRDEFFTKINTFTVPFEALTRKEQFIFLLRTNDTEKLTLSMLFIERCLQIRQSSGRYKINAAVTNLFQRDLQHFILVIICVVCPVRWYTSYMSLKCLLCFYVLYVFEVSFMFS